MANGFFLGGLGEGIASSRKAGLAELANEQDVGLRTRALELGERNANRVAGQKDTERFDGLISDTMTQVSEIVKASLAGGKDAATIKRTVAPLVQSAKDIAGRIGRNPAALDAQVDALLTQPDMVTAATVAGTAKGAGQAAAAIAETRALNAAGYEAGGTIKDPKDRAAAENSLRDDFTKQAQPFITQRDAKARLDNIETTGAGDMALVFTYMKLLDPTSTVREGEYASAANAAGVPSAVQGLYNKMIGGGTLDTKARSEIKSQANKFYETAAKQHDKLQTQFAGIAKRQGLKVDNVIVDFGPAAPDGKDTFGKRFEGTTPGGLKFRVN